MKINWIYFENLLLVCQNMHFHCIQCPISWAILKRFRRFLLTLDLVCFSHIRIHTQGNTENIAALLQNERVIKSTLKFLHETYLTAFILKAKKKILKKQIVRRDYGMYRHCTSASHFQFKMLLCLNCYCWDWIFHLPNEEKSDKMLNFCLSQAFRIIHTWVLDFPFK